MRFVRVAMIAAVICAVAACGGVSRVGPATVAEFPEFGFKLQVPPGWMNIAGDIQNRHATQFTFKLESLVGAKRSFLDGLPQTIEPELIHWTQFHFMDVTERSRGDCSVGGLPAWTVTYEAKVTRNAEITLARYWVVVKGELLYLFRVVFPPGREPEDGPAAETMIQSIQYIETPKADYVPIFPSEPIQKMVRPN